MWEYGNMRMRKWGEGGKGDGWAKGKRRPKGKRRVFKVRGSQFGIVSA